MPAQAEELTFRSVDLAADEEFLYELYTTTRDDLTSLGIDPQQLGGLMRMQYTAQKESYLAAYPGAEHKIISLSGVPVGRMIVQRGKREILFVDLAILPEYRNRGIGSRLILDRIREAEDANGVLTFHVLKTNPAINLYLRLGCAITGDAGMYYRMEWRPNFPESAADTAVK
ncbi:MAG: GNAT family N-acetyltransferase [Acidobacteriota bacterium]